MDSIAMQLTAKREVWKTNQSPNLSHWLYAFIFLFLLLLLFLDWAFVGWVFL